MFAGDFAARYPSALRHRSMEPKVQHRAHGDGFSMSGLDAKRAGEAIRFLAYLRHVAIAVCCDDKDASTWAKEAGRKPEHGLPLLLSALDELARFYVVEEAG